MFQFQICFDANKNSNLKSTKPCQFFQSIFSLKSRNQQKNFLCPFATENHELSRISISRQFEINCNRCLKQKTISSYQIIKFSVNSNGSLFSQSKCFRAGIFCQFFTVSYDSTVFSIESIQKLNNI